VLDFIIAIFLPQATMQMTELSYETVTNASLDRAIDHDHDRNVMRAHPLPKFLKGDQIRLKQILINLVKNALKFCKRGQIRIVLTFDEAQNMLKVHIVDSGKGIVQEDMTKLFSLFGKLQRTAEINSEGIGLGLMICKNLV
jgi:signal transduction histidine kinase